MKNFIKIILINFAVFVALAFSVELFFSLNTQQHWITNDTDIEKTRQYHPTKFQLMKQYQLDLNAAANIPWVYPDPTLPELQGLNGSNLYYRKKYASFSEPFDMRELHFENATGKATVAQTGLTIYTAEFHYKSDSQHRNAYRLSDFQNPKAEKFILHFGDSFVFGEGVNQPYTLPSQLNKALPTFNGYNFGLPATAPSDFLRLIETNQDHRSQWVKEKEGVLIYHYLNFHINRMVCTLLCYSPAQAYRLDKLEYKLINGEPVLVHEKFSDRQPLSFFYSWLVKSETLKFFNFDYPIRFSKDDFQLFAQVLDKVFNYYEKNLHVTGKYIALHPYIDPNEVALIKEVATPLHIQVLDYSGVNMRSLLAKKSRIPVDSHPTGNYNNIMAQLIAHDLQNSK